MNRKCSWLLGLSMIVAWPLYVEASGLRGELDCPTTVQVREPLTVTVRLLNNDYFDSKSVARVMKAVTGNAGGSLSLLGPNVRTFDPPIVVPPASGCGTFQFTPGETTVTMKATRHIPETFANKAVMVFVGGIDDMGHAKGGLTCFTNVTQ